MTDLAFWQQAVIQIAPSVILYAFFAMCNFSNPEKPIISQRWITWASMFIVLCGIVYTVILGSGEQKQMWIGVGAAYLNTLWLLLQMARNFKDKKIVKIE